MQYFLPNEKKNLTLNLAICTMLGGSCTLIGCTPQLTANALLFETTGTSLSMFTMFAPGFLMLLFYLFFTQLLAIAWASVSGEGA